ncbi:hypothetical protein ACH4ZX_03740 [Streptomyces sp. NPDC020490]|uniref:hypothetical protein n=1 Tax=Streptomyces sp. NPDC020490 TaxID=3365078 RepID=UPI0037873539
MTDHTTALDAIAEQLRRIADALSTPASPAADEDDAPTATADDGPRCVCGDPIEQTGDPAYWIHSPGSDTPCLHARPESVTLATPCTGCGHAYNWHGGSKASCQLGDEVKRCGCEGFTTEAQPATTPAGRPACVPDHATTSTCPGCTWDREHPTTDEDEQRIARRDSTSNLLARLARDGILSEAETALLRQHVHAEQHDTDMARAVASDQRVKIRALREKLSKAQREADTARETAALSLGRDLLRDGLDVFLPRLVGSDHAACILSERPSRTAELEQAQAAIDRVRAVEQQWAGKALPHSEAHRMLTDLRAALDGNAPAAPTEADQPLPVPRNAAITLHRTLGELLGDEGAQAIARVRALHQREYDGCGWCSTNDRYQEWPCPTIRALDGEQP